MFAGFESDSRPQLKAWRLDIKITDQFLRVVEAAVGIYSQGRYQGG